MNKEEFELLVGRVASESEFRVAEATYMAMPDSVDKKKFAEKWKSSIDEFYEVEVFDALALVLDSADATEKDAREKITKLNSELAVANTISKELREHIKTLDKEAEETRVLIETIKAIDINVLLKAKIKIGMALTEEEKEEIISLL